MGDAAARYLHLMDVQKVLVRHLSISVFYDVKTRSSFCWKYFGNLVMDIEGAVVEADKLFCLACLTAIKMESEDVTFGSVNIKSYKKSVSTGNLTRHLREMHMIMDDGSEESEPEVPSNQGPAAKKRKIKKTSMVDVGVMTEPEIKELDQAQLTTDMTLWFCKSLMPLEIVSEGMQDFFKKYEVIRSADQMPSRDTVNLTIDNIYQEMYKRFHFQITTQHDLQHLALAFETWTDQRRRGNNYITVTLHYLKTDFVLNSMNIGTHIVGDNIEENMSSILKTTREKLCLINPIHIVTQADENAKQIVDDSNLLYHECIGNGFHNLVTIDGIEAVPEIKSLVRKCKNIIQAMVPCLQKLEDWKEISDDQKEFISGLGYITAYLDGDENDPIPNNITKQEDSKKSVSKSSKHQGRLLRIECVSSTGALPLIPTRWHIILVLLECFIQINSRDLFKRIIKMSLNAATLTKTEWALIESLVAFLRKFRDVVEVVSSQKTCTINVALLFRSEIKDILETTDSDSIIVELMKSNMLAKIDKRLPVTETIVAAALLDTRFIGLKEVDNFLKLKNQTKIAFLAETVRDVLRDVSLPNSEDEEDYEDGEEFPDNSLLEKLLQKHRADSEQEVKIKDPIEKECWTYFATADPTVPKDGNMLKYWNSKQADFFWLGALARSLLCIPATSAPAHRMFSTAGLDFSIKRSAITPCRLNKIMFIHDNCEALEKAISIKPEKTY